MEKLNIAELLKDCPSGMELDCTMYDSVTLLNVNDSEDITFPIKVLREDGNYIALTKYGQYTDADFAKCVIFPKGKTTWEGFVPPYKFKEGDVIYVEGLREWVAIVNSCNDNAIYDHVALENKTILHFSDNLPLIRFSDKPVKIRLAIEEEKKKLFDSLKEQGYKWNTNTNTLEKLPETKFKVGDRIKNKNVNLYHTVNSILGGSYIVDDNLVLDMKMEHLYELAPDIKPKFKIGDRIKKDKDYISGIVTDIFDDSFKVTYDGGGCSYVQFHYQDAWELVPDKFDITTLIPFESRVLVRNHESHKWSPAMWGYYDCDSQNYPYIIVGDVARYCIPYEGNEHLLGTTKDCDDYYKTW